MPEKKIRPITWLIPLLGLLMVAGFIAAFAAAPGESSGGQPTPSGSSASPEATATGPVDNGGNLYPNGTSGLGEPYLFGSSDAPKTLTIWEDMECPACAAFEYDAQEVLGDALQEAELAIEYYIAPTSRQGSVDSALALACAADQDMFKDLHLTLFVNQFPEEDKGYTPEMILEIAELVEIPDMEAFEECFASGKYEDYVASIVDKGIAEGISGTPYILLDGEQVSLRELGWEGFVAAIGLDPKKYPYETEE